MAPIFAIAMPLRRVSPFAPRAWRGVAVVALLALLVACSGADEPSVAPAETPTSTPARATVAAPSPTVAPIERTLGLLFSAPESFEGYTLFSKEDSASGANAYLIDHQGRLVHQWPLGERLQPVKLLPNGNLLAGRDGAAEIAPDGSVVWEYAHEEQHHDLLKLPNGNVLLLARETLTQEEAIAAGADPELVGEQGLLGVRVIEVRPTGASGGEIVWEWSVFDHLVQDFDPAKPNYGVVAERPELVDVNFTLAESVAVAREAPRETWTHANSLDYNAELDQIMISVRHFSEVWIIDHSATTDEAAGHTGGAAGKGGDLLYRWGNPRAHRAGTADDQRLFWQHDAHWIPDGLSGAGNMLVFNNGNEFLRDGRRFYSTVDEIVLPSEDGYRAASGADFAPSDTAWIYADDPPRALYSPNLSSAQRLPNGNTLICNGNFGIIFEVTPDGRKAWEYVNPVTDMGPLRQGETPPIVQTRRRVERLSNQLHRAYRYAPDYPGLRGLDLTPGDPLELPAAP